VKTRIKISVCFAACSPATLICTFAIVALSAAISSADHFGRPTTSRSNTAFDVNGSERTFATRDSSIGKTQTLTFADRVAYQCAIEEVYWRHRIWPKENVGPKPPLDAFMSRAEIENKVDDYLRKSQALEDYWQVSLMPDQLRAEVERMAGHTQQPEVLREIFAALRNDSFVVAECLARPIVAERLLTQLYAHDQRFHGELRRRIEAELRMHPGISELKQTSGTYTEMEWDKGHADANLVPVDPKHVELVTMSDTQWNESVTNLAKCFGGEVPRRAIGSESTDISAYPEKARAENYEMLPVGEVSPLQDDERHYYAVAVIKKDKTRLRLATISWLKEPLRSWVAKVKTGASVTITAATASYRLPEIISPPANSTLSRTATDRRNAMARVTDVSKPIRVDTRHVSIPFNPITNPVRTCIVCGTPFPSPTATATGTATATPTSTATPTPVCTDDTWIPTSTTNAPTARYWATAVWTGSEMIVWGGYDGSRALDSGGLYNPSTDNWTATNSVNAPVARYNHTAVWTGNEMIVWGGANSNIYNTGGRYNPVSDIWTQTGSNNGSLQERSFHTAVWTGSEMIVWGGVNDNGNALNTGDKYNPASNSWTTVSTTNAPDARWAHTAVSTNSEMIVWGGINSNSSYLNSGGRYTPSADVWTPTSTTNAPAARWFHTALWTGSEMIVWGGSGSIGESNTGGRYNPDADSWLATSISNAPIGREQHTAIWSGSEMIVWGGFNGSYLNTGGRYNPRTDNWMMTSNANAPTARSRHAAVWTGTQMIVWAGVLWNTGGKYCAQSGATATATPTSTPTPTPCVGRCSPTPRPRRTPPPRP
jgi:N-acetylneuraminic acid mutarotase